MNYLHHLKSFKEIIDVQLYSIDKNFSFLTDGKQKDSAASDTESVYTYKILYKVGKLRVVGYICVPKKGTVLPVLLHMRGGSNNFSMLSEKSIYLQMIRFSAQGYIVASTQYPGVEGGDGKDGFGSKDDIESILALKKIVCKLPTANTKRVGVKGHSRGGLMIYMLLRDASWIKCGVIGSAPTNQIRQAKVRDGWRKHQITMWGSSKEEVLKRSPIYWADKLYKRTPLLIVHGSSDWRVDPLDSIDMSKRLFELKIPHRFILYEGADHSITEYSDEYYMETLTWLDRFLKKNEKLPVMKSHGK